MNRNIIIDRKELKQRARELMAQTQPRPILVTLVYLLIVYSVSIAVNLVGSVSGVLAVGGGAYVGENSSATMLYFFMNILVMLFSAVLQFGYTAYHLRVSDRGESGYRDLFSGFPEVGRVVLMNLAIAGFYFVWALAIVFPGTILLMAATIALSALHPALGVTVAVVIYIGMIALLLFVMVRYSLSTLVLADDPDIGPLNAVRRSRSLLRGRNGEFIVLELSFLGWGLLCALIMLVVMGSIMAFTYLVLQTKTAIMLGVLVAMLLGFLAALPLSVWLQPYIGITTALYYRALAPGKRPPAPDELPNPSTPWRPDSEE